MISIQPKWCELIASGKKTVEVRKTRPKLQTPFKVYIYCTKDNTDFVPSRIWWRADNTGFQYIMNGKVIGEFVCDKITHCDFTGSCLDFNELLDYAKGKQLYGWHISNLVIYDKPRELSEFFYACNKPKGTDCSICVDYRENRCKSITRPPQSWYYVESED